MGKVIEIGGLISFNEVAKRLGVSRALLTYLRNKGKIDYYKIGEHYFVDEVTLRQLEEVYGGSPHRRGPRAKLRL